MNAAAVFHVVSIILILLGLVMMTAAPVGWIMGDTASAIQKMLISALIPFFFGLISAALTRKKDRKYGIREGFGIVAFSWIAAGIFGAVPYCLVENFYIYDAIFETVSGFTTTGASVVDSTMRLREGTLANGVESLSYGILYWRSMTHWLGGMGFVVLSVAILPFLGLGTHNLFKAETTGPTASQLTPRITSAAKLLWGVYLVLTIILAVLLRAADMGWFDAWCHACATMATGGFSTKQASIAAFNSSTINAITTFFMFFAGINFILHVRLFRGEPLAYFRDEEFRWYTIMIGASTILITLVLFFTAKPLLLTTGLSIDPSFSNCIQHSLFNVVSLITTTGFGTVDFSAWPLITILVIMLLFLAGGCGGSTSGGLKQSRLIILIKYSVAQIEYCLFPHAKVNVRFNQTRVEMSAVYKILGFFILYISVCVALTMLIQLLCTFTPGVAEKMTMDTTLTILLSALSNVGPGAGTISPMYSYGWLPESVKLILSAAMIIGRLEFFTILILFLPSFWRK